MTPKSRPRSTGRNCDATPVTNDERATMMITATAQFSRSRSSDSSGSSLSSTFSDLITSSTSESSKTNAFFASPFSTRPPSPNLPSSPQPKTATPSRSLTADFFATPVKSPSPPTTSTAQKHHTIDPSRIFPSRYTSTVQRSPDFVSLDITHLSPTSYERSPSSGSDSSFTSSFIETRLPTPPPPPLSRLPPTSSNFEPSSSEPTPRPPNLEPTLLHFERSLLLAAQEKQKRDNQPDSELKPDLSDDDEVEEDPHPGSIISLNTDHHSSLSPLELTFANAIHYPVQNYRGTPTPTNEPSKSGQFICCLYLWIYTLSLILKPH